MPVLRYVPVDETEVPLDLVPFAAEGFDTEPLSHEDFVECVARGRPYYPLKITNAIPLEQEGRADAQAMTVTTQMGLPTTPTLYGLVLGGWLPFPFSAKRTVLVDRNVVSHIETLRAEDLSGENKGADAAGWPYCSFDLAGEQVSPLLYAFEGRNRRTPTREEVAAEAVRGGEALARVLPRAKLLAMGEVQQAALFNILQERAATLERRCELLLRTGPLVAQPVAERLRPQVEAEIISLSRSCGVPPKSLPVAGLLSCLYDSHDAPAHPAFRPGRAVLKPSRLADSESAYNALADLSFLELLLQLSIAMPESGYVLYTRDKGLAAFWSALQPRVLPDRRAGLSPVLRLDRAAFPGLDASQCESLVERLEHEAAKS